MDSSLQVIATQAEPQAIHDALLDHAPEYALVLSRAGHVEEATGAVAALLGYQRYELNGIHYAELVAPEYLTHFSEIHTRVSAGPEADGSWRSILLTRDGSQVSVTLTSSAAPYSPDCTGHLIRITDAPITHNGPFPTISIDPAALGEQLQDALDREQKLLRFTERINTLDPGRLYEMALNALFELVECDGCVLGTTDHGSGSLICQGAKLRDGEFGSLPGIGIGDLLSRTATNMPFFNQMPQRYIPENAYGEIVFLRDLSSARFESAVITPLVIESQNNGSVIAIRRAKDAFSRAEARMLKLITSIFSARLQSAYLHSSLHGHERDLIDVQDINRLVMSNLEVDASLQAILASAPRIFDAQGCSVRIVDGDALIPAATIGESAGSFPERVPLSSSLAGTVVKRAVPMLISDLKTNPRTRHNVAQKGITARGWAAAPMIDLDGKPFGVLSVHTDTPRFWNERDRSLLVTMANATAIAYRNAWMFEQTRDMFRASVDSLASAVDAKDSYTHDHSRNVAYYARATARAMDLSPEETSDIELAGLLHDIGKIGIPDRILQKRGSLDPAEWAAMQMHTSIGESILSGNPILEPLQPIIRYHHERWDGTGYPDQLEGYEIPLGAAIVALADAIDTMSRDRLYRQRRSWDETLLEVEHKAGTQFHPAVVDAFLSAVSTGAVEPQMPESSSDIQRIEQDGDERASLPEDPRALAVFRRVATAIRGLVDLEVFLTNITQILVDELQLEDEALAIFLLEEQTGDLIVYGQSPQHEPGRIPAGRGISGWVARNGTSQNIPDVGQDPRFIANTRLKTGSELAVPLIARGSVFGVINIESPELSAFTEKDKQLLVSTADHLAHAIYAARVHDQFKRISVTDALTGLGNHRQFYEQLKREIDHARLTNDEVTIAIMDINQLKAINDTYGHLAGDKALRAVADVLNRARRRGDLVCRYGGDEFAVILPATGAGEARQVIEFLETAVENSQFESSETVHRLPVGSWGTASYPVDGTRPSELVRVADLRMYRAKAMV